MGTIIGFFDNFTECCCHFKTCFFDNPNWLLFSRNGRAKFMVFGYKTVSEKKKKREGIYHLTGKKIMAFENSEYARERVDTLLEKFEHGKVNWNA